MNKSTRFVILFFAGCCLGGDTDSCFGRFWVPKTLKTRDEIFDYIYKQSFLVQEICDKLYPRPVALEFENVKSPFLLTPKKKTYAAIQLSSAVGGYNLPPEPKAAIKGMAAKKRDKCEWAHKIGFGLLKRLLENKNDSIETYAAWYKAELDKIPRTVLTTIEELAPFIITCALNSEYKKDDGVLALSLAKMIADFTGAMPKPGQRLAYLSAYFRDDRLHANACVIPDVFLQRKYRIDIAYYLEKQIWNCVKQILCLPVHDALRDHLDLITKRYIHEWKNKTDGRRELTAFFTRVPSAKRLKT